MTERRFAVVIHDVAPLFHASIEQIVERLEPRVGRVVGAAVVPCWHGRPIGGGEGSFTRFVGRAFGEILQHGYTHRRDRPGLISWFTGRSDELGGLSGHAVLRRVCLGREVLSQALGIAPAGFVPPAWRAGRLTASGLAGCGLRYMAGFGGVWSACGRVIPVVTWSWDWGVLGWLGGAGHLLGTISRRLRPLAVPCVVLHPADVERGYLPAALGVIDGLLQLGWRPVLLSGLLE